MCGWTMSANEPRQMHDKGAFKSWRNDRGYSRRRAAKVLGVPYATYCRYESGWPPPLDRANEIAAKTGGKIRYRDMWPHFNPDFA